MVVHVNQIEEEGLTINEPLGAELLAGALVSDGKDTGFRARDGFLLNARFQKVSGAVLLSAQFRPRLLGSCARCLTDVTVDLPVTFTLNLIPERVATPDEFAGEDDEHSARAGSFNLEEADEEIFDGHTIDLDPILCEQVLLALPMHVVCRDDCKGLCSLCGQNLNEGCCSCDRKIPDPRWNALKHIKIN